MTQLERNAVIWSSLDQPGRGLEYCWFSPKTALGTILRLDEQQLAFQLGYQLAWNERYELQEAALSVYRNGESKNLVLNSESIKKYSGCQNCQDIDIWPTPLTNSLTLKRLNLEIGGRSEIDVLWIEAPSLSYQKRRQIYTRVDTLRYFFESPEENFRATITLDDDGFVRHYPELFERRF